MQPIPEKVAVGTVPGLIRPKTNLWGQKYNPQENWGRILRRIGLPCCSISPRKSIVLGIKYVQNKLGQVMQRSVTWLEVQFRQWIQPTETNQVAGTLADLKRSRSKLIAENMFLRQKSIVLERQVPRPRSNMKHSSARDIFCSYTCLKVRLLTLP